MEKIRENAGKSLKEENLKMEIRVFTSFSPKFFLTIFLVKSKLSTAKRSKTTTFSRVFHPKQKSTSFREI